MSFLRRFISAGLILEVTLLNLLLGAAVYGLEKTGLIPFSNWNLPWLLIFLLGLSTLGNLLLIFFKLHLPLKKIIQEMKALLTGRSYRRIMTKKRNEIGVLAHFFNEITRNLESISGDVKSHARLQKEVNIAQNIQRDLLPTAPPKIPGLEISAKTRPASEIGGDSFDFFLDKNRYFIYIGDSTGHGIPAGIVMVMVDTLIETFMDLYDSLRDIMVQLNKYLKPHLQTTMFMTMLLLEWMPEKNCFHWVGAGHEYLIHVQTQKGAIESIASGGIAVGMVPDNSALVQQQEIQMETNDFLVLYSDGITEAKNITGETYGLERLKKFIQIHMSVDISANELFEKIAVDVGRFMEGRPQDDDMTLIVMKRTNSENLGEPVGLSNEEPA